MPLDYDEMEKAMYTELASAEVEAFGAAEKSLKLLQLASGAMYTINSVLR